MGCRGDGLVDGGKGPIGANLHVKAIIGILLENGGGQVARGGGGRSNSWSLGRHNVR